MTTKLNQMKIELVKDVKDNGELETEVFYSPKFIPFSKLIRATKTLEKVEDKSEMEAIDEMFQVVADLYNNQFTAQELSDGLHAPDAVRVIRENIEFISTGELPEDAKKAKK
ncbi:phage tail assembly chaperone G [Staphylococcus saprophyticus]|uniref:phage tail assembly chaperone G n=1 Tax=Staphylococcus saprophyticus TaxID=29385 RepID=UPI0008529570|nr:hypothetical protein [Staphylococcus saprophyticus]OEK41308.1 hypothetical protein ASS88_01475 [Staphylococcus saprophyticus]